MKSYRRNTMKKGERHREFDVGARVVVNKKAPGGYEARLGTGPEIVLGSRYGVRFDNPQEPIVDLNSEWLDAAAQGRNTQLLRHVQKGIPDAPRPGLRTG